jgi:hypothetical protein
LGPGEERFSGEELLPGRIGKMLRDGVSNFFGPAGNIWEAGFIAAGAKNTGMIFLGGGPPRRNL